MRHRLSARSTRRCAATVIIATAACVPLTATTWAGVDRWTEIGLEGERMREVVFDPAIPSRAYARGVTGSYVSLDGGSRWHRLRGGLDIGAGVALRPVNGVAGHLYTLQDGLRRSTDGGLTWQRVAPLPAGRLQGLGVLPTQPLTIFLAVQEPGEVDPVIYRSRDGGTQWQAVLGEIRNFRGFESDPFDPAAVYVWGGEILWRSPDGGDHWTQLTAGLPPEPFRINDLVPSPSVQGALYALVFSPESDRLLFSHDAGESWAPVGTLPFSRCQKLGIQGQDEHLLVSCGLGVSYRSERGEGWEPIEGLADFTAIASDPLHSSRLLASSQESPGLFRSEDAGRTWHPSARGIRGRRPGTPTLSPSDPLTLYAADGCDLLASRDGGVTWQRRPGPPDCPLGLEVEAVDPGDPQTLYVATAPREFAVEKPLYRSRDGGRSWTHLGQFPGGPMAIHPTDPQVLLAGPLGIHRSDDAGESWRRVFPALGVHGHQSLHRVRFGSGTPATVVAEIVHSNVGNAVTALWASPDGGESWERTDAANLLAVVPDGATEVWAALTPVGRFAYSLDLGRTWLPVSVPSDTLLVVPSLPPVLYTRGEETALVSRDRGATWDPVPHWDELLPEYSATPTLVHPLAPETVINRGLFRATFANSKPLELHGGRIEARSAWRGPDGSLAAGQPRPISAGSGAFWFHRPGNLELLVKTLDGRSINGRFWAFAAALTDLAWEITLLDTLTGRDVTWQSRPGEPSSHADLHQLTELLPAAISPSIAPTPSQPRPTSALTAGSGSNNSSPECATTALCLLGARFQVELTWDELPAGEPSSGRPLPLTETGGAFWLRRPENLEVAVKILDGRAINGRFWVFVGGLTDRAHTVIVTDLESDQVRRYRNPAGALASRIDTAAFGDP